MLRRVVEESLDLLQVVGQLAPKHGGGVAQGVCVDQISAQPRSASLPLDDAVDTGAGKRPAAVPKRLLRVVHRALDAG